MIDSQYLDKVTKEIKKYEKKTEVPLDSFRVFKEKKTYQEAFSEIIKYNSIRADGRKLDEHRKMCKYLKGKLILNLVFFS